MIVDAKLASCSLAIFSRLGDAEPEVIVPLAGASATAEPGFPRCFTLTTSDALRVFLRAPTQLELDSWLASLRAAMPLPPLQTKQPKPVTERIACGRVRVQLHDSATEWASMFACATPGLLHLFASPLDPTPDPSILLGGGGKSIALEDGVVAIRDNNNNNVFLLGADDAETAQWERSLRELQKHPPTNWDIMLAAGFASDYLRKKPVDLRADALSMFLTPEVKPVPVTAGAASTWKLGFARVVPDLKPEDFSVVLSNQAGAGGSVVARGAVLDNLAVSITPRLAGKHFLHVRFRDFAVFGSPLELNILPMAPSPRHSLISAPDNVVVGAPSTFAVTLRDKLLNLCGPLANPSNLKVQTAGPVRVDFVRDEGTGAYTVGFTALPGNSPCQLAVTLFDAPVAGSPVLPRVVAAASAAAPTAQPAALPAVDAAAGALAAERAAAGLSALLRRDFATPAVDAVMPRGEQVQLLMTGAAIRSSRPMPRDAPVVINGAEWTPEPLPPPWAPPSVLAAFARRTRRDLDEVLAPLAEAARLEWQGRLEPASEWRRLLVDWPGPAASTANVAALGRAVEESPLEHREALAKLCELVVKAEATAPVAANAQPLPGGLRGRMQLLRDAAARSPAKPSQALVLAAAATTDAPIDDDDDDDDVSDDAAPQPSPLSDAGSSSSPPPPSPPPPSPPVMRATAAESQAPPELPSVGERCVLDGAQPGVVRHVGAANFAPGLWVGLEMDGAVGRNDGAVLGVRYFTCAPNHGIFGACAHLSARRLTTRPQCAPSA